jgi:glycine/D-amino acid oxidase-like deaminating enzyme
MGNNGIFQEAEVCIIGGGIIGCSTAFRLSQMGKKVVVVEKTYPGAEASTATAGTMAVQNKLPGSVFLTLESLKIWQHLSEELEWDTGFEMRGGYRLAYSEEEWNKLEKDVHIQRKLGVSVEIIPQEMLRKQIPYISPKVLAAGYCPQDSKANPLVVTSAFFRAARRLGTVFLTNARVTGIEVLGDMDFIVKTRAGNVRAPIVVNAANVWAGQIAQMVGYSIPVTMEIQMAMITNGGPPVFPHIITAVKGNLTLKQEFPSGRVIIGGGWNGNGDYISEVKQVNFDNLVKNLQTASNAVPELEGREIVRVWACYEGRSPDLLLMIGPISSPKGFYVQCCVKGGFTLAPIVGVVMAEWLTKGKPHIPMDDYLVTRFETYQPYSVEKTGE